MKFVYFVGGIVFSIVVCAIIFGFVVQDGIILDFTRQALIEQDNRLEIEDGKHVIIITRREREAPELSIDCDKIHLTDLSGETVLPFLRPNQKAIIKFTVNNDGGTANNVEVYWGSLQVPKGLELTRTQPIGKLERHGVKPYEIEVIARNMGAQKIVLEFYPIGKMGLVLASMNEGPVCQFEFVVAPE